MPSSSTPPLADADVHDVVLDWYVLLVRRTDVVVVVTELFRLTDSMPTICIGVGSSVSNWAVGKDTTATGSILFFGAESDDVNGDEVVVVDVNDEAINALRPKRRGDETSPDRLGVGFSGSTGAAAGATGAVLRTGTGELTADDG